MEQVEPVNDTLLLTEWQALLRQTSPEVHTLLTSLSDEEIRHLVTVFYDYMLSHAESALFLNTEQVSTRLSGSMFDWLRSVLGSAHEDLSQLLAKQRKIGVVHARIGLPIDLVNRGARKLKDELYRVLKTKADSSRPAERCYLFQQSGNGYCAGGHDGLLFPQFSKLYAHAGAVPSTDYLR